jgi:hypothetical protein
LSIDYFGTGSTHYWIQVGIDQPGANLHSSDCGSFTPPCVYFEKTATSGAYTYTPIKSIADSTLVKLEMKTGSNCSGGSGRGNHYWCAFVDGVSVGSIDFGTIYPGDEGEGLESYHASSGPCNDVYYEFDNGVPGWSSLPTVSVDSPYEMFTWGTGSGLGSGFATDLNTGALQPLRAGATAFTVPATVVAPSVNVSPRHQFITSHPNLP